jgi:phospholipid/cholesterol/gamma-HCH transport system ATP-binding protein
MTQLFGSSVEVANITKFFGEKKVIDNLSFSCSRGESVVVLGESGTGKSVLMKMVGMLLDVSAGSIKIDEDEIVGISEVKRNRTMRKVGFLFQFSGLFEHLTIIENVAFRELFVQKINKLKAYDMAAERLHQTGIKDIAFNLKPTQISGGMQKRVAMARTLMKEPKLILLDEPTSGLDPVMSEKINNVILATRRVTNATMITITHDLNSAIKISDRIFVLRQGRFIWQGKTNDIFNAEDCYIQEFVRSANVMH